MPRLADSVLSIYVEATREETEIRLLRSLQRQCPELPRDLDLKQSLAAIRRGIAIGHEKKVLLVLDQYEQWLHANRSPGQSELATALRQCDGERVQCVLLVRDDFWLAVSRFMQQIEIPLVEGRNSVLVDLFDLTHAQKVLAAFGTTLGALPERVAELTKQQASFLRQAVAGLARDGRVICVQLALFAEMMKARPWTPNSLRQVGGTEGLGVAFLEETFSAASAPTSHRLHQTAALALLKALMPEAGHDIKGSRRSYEKLRAAAGYEHRPDDFNELLRTLDGELRLITPVAMTDADDVTNEGGSTQSAQSDAKYYQLTHDYVVVPLREWLARKQRETRRGRAAFRLAERTEFWSAKPENRHSAVSLTAEVAG